MRLAFDISPAVHRALDDRARQSGMTLESWVADLLSKQAEPVTSPDQAGSWVDDWLRSTPRMLPEDVRALEEAIAWADAASLAEGTIEPTD